MTRRLAPSVRAVAVAALFGAELVHTAVIGQHLREWAWSGVFFLIISVLEGGLGAALWFAPSRRVARSAIVVSGATAALWLISRTVGLPFGPEAWVRGPVGQIDLAATLLELTTVAALVAGRGPIRWTQRQVSTAFAVVVVITAIGLIAGPGPAAVAPGAHALAH